MRPLKILLLLIGFVPLAQAQDIINSQEVNTSTQNTTINSTITGNYKDWGLTQEEWAQYQQLMQGMDAKWYPNLTPPEILGLHAQTMLEQQHFAELAAKQEHDKLAQELAFNQAFHEAMLKLYPDEPLIKSFDLSPFNPVKNTPHQNTVSLQKGDHLILFVDTMNDTNFFLLPHLLTTIKNNPEVILDIYCPGNIDDNVIRAWAKFHRIPMDLVAAGKITLNHDHGKYKKMAGNNVLPALLLVHDGETKVVNIWNLA